MSDTSHRLALPYLMPAQAQKHVTHNEALQALDAVVQLTLAGVDSVTPPLAPALGETHALGAEASGAWSGQTAGHLAYWNGAGWLFAQPAHGWRAWDVAGGQLLIHLDGVWSPLVEGGALDVLGVNATADEINRLAVAAQSSLFTHDGTGHQIKINKAQTADDAGFVFQTNYTTHALFGLLANDDFSLKVSPDGSTFKDALGVDGATGIVDVAQGMRLKGGNVLDAYARGTWNPIFGASSTNPSGAAFNSTGQFVRIGSLVMASFEMVISNRGSGGAGNVQINGLPFASSGSFYSSDLRHAGVSFPGSGAPMMRSSGTTLTLFSSDGVDLRWSSLSASSNFSLLGTFIYQHNG